MVETEKILNFFLFMVPAVIVCAIAYYFFKEFIRNENNRRRFLLQKDLQKEALPLRLQAYERMAIFLERIAPAKLLVRVHPMSSNKESYESLLIATIEQEFEHNLSQQIYISDQCWNVINAAKNATIQLIRKGALSEKTDTANKLREVLLTEMMEKPSPSGTALAYIKKEVSDMW